MSKKIGDRTDLLTKEEMNRLIMSVATDLYYYTLYNTLRYTGRRIGEIYGTVRNKKLIGGLKVIDINFDELTMTTQILKTKKRNTKIVCSNCKIKTTFRNRFCPECGCVLPVIDLDSITFIEPETKTFLLVAELAPILKAFIKDRKLKNDDYLFREYSLSNLKQQIRIHTKRANINKRFTLHGFRHYFITNCKVMGMSNEDIAKWTGHKSPQMLNNYDRRTSKDVEDQIARVDL